ncbi:Rv3235 family protein [Modestobacter sp. NPDC049651]|uniref:Rv3235 family protein n=1 Tax=unclassified Modestobacter TaxID=2643866 RepID=UPI0033D85DBF
MSAPASPLDTAAPARAAHPGDADPGDADRSRLHLVVVPTPGPPLLDERVPLRLVVPGRVLPRPAPAPGPRPRTGPTPAGPGDDRHFGPTWTRRTDLPDAAVTGRRLVTLVLEAFAGRRPVSQLQAVVSPPVFAALSSGRRPRWCAEGTSPVLVGAVRVCEPVDGVAEVSAVARRSGRAHAVAARLEGIDGRWRCTSLQIG